MEIQLHEAARSKSDLEPHLHSALHAPLEKFLSRPHKAFRAGLVNLGFELFAPNSVQPWQQALRARLQSAIETLHAGSLIVDDIQDGSRERRGEACLHRQIGMPLALNAGNWLYFSAYQQILESGAPDSVKLACVRDTTDILLRAHQGQALDLAIRAGDMNPADIPKLCRQSLEGKSGALMEFALVLGARAAMASEEQIAAARRLGRELGVNLQMFDDLGNLNLKKSTAKHLEDLSQERPSFVWWVLAERFPHCFDQFKQASRQLPDLEALSECLEKTRLLDVGRAQALQHQNDIFFSWEQSRVAHAIPALEKIQSLSQRIAHAYH